MTQISEPDYSVLFALSNVGQVQFDISTAKILRANRKIGELLGYSTEELVTMTLMHITHPEDLSKSGAALEALSANSIADYAFEKRCVRKDGSTIWVNVNAIAVQDEQGSSRYAIAVIQDITARKQSEHNALFLASMSEALIAQTSVDRAIELATERLGTYMQVDCCFMDEVDHSSDQQVVHPGYSTNPSAMPGTHQLSTQPAEILNGLRLGQAVVVDDTYTDPRTAPFWQAIYEPLGVGAGIVIPRMHNGEWAASLVVTCHASRGWTTGEVALVRSVADLAWLSVERLRSAQQYRESEERYRALVQSTSLVTWSIDPQNNRSDEFEDFWERLTGQSRAEYRNGGWVKVVHPDDREFAQEVWRQAEKTHELFSTTYRVRAKDGSYRYLAMSGVPLFHQDGSFRQWIGTINDVTASKEAEIVLQRANESLNLALSAVSGFFYDFDRLNGKVERGGAFQQVVGFDPSDVPEHVHWWLDRIHPEDREKASRAVDKAVAEGESYAVEYRVQHKAGHYIDIWDSGAVIRDSSGQAIRQTGITLDMTERKRMDIALRVSEDRYRRIVETANEGVWMVDNEGITRFQNRHMAEMLGYSEEDHLVGRSAFELLFEEDIMDVATQFEQSKQGTRNQFELRFRRKDGSPIWTYITTAPMLDEQGNPDGVLGMVTDSTERKLVDEERERLLEREQETRVQAQEAVRVRDAFFSVASHELKNPLTALYGNAQLLQRRGKVGYVLTERDERTIATISEQASRLNKMITAMLDTSRLESGKLSIEREDFDLCELMRQVMTEIQSTTERHTLTYTGDMGPLIISGDMLRLEQVIHNLIQNAIKYSPEGGRVTLQAEHHGSEVCVSIIDQGIGIPESFLPHLFHRFHRAENAEQLHISGMGIGLYVVKEIVSMHGGRVEVESTEREGSTFKIFLPLSM